MRAGEKVCIQRISPTHRGSALASLTSVAMASPPVITGLTTMARGISGLSSSAARDLPRVVGNQGEDFVPVEDLTPGDEPEFRVAGIDHGFPCP